MDDGFLFMWIIAVFDDPGADRLTFGTSYNLYIIVEVFIIFILLWNFYVSDLCLLLVTCYYYYYYLLMK